MPALTVFASGCLVPVAAWQVFVRCPVKLNQLKRYLAAKRKAGSKASVVHVAIRALGRALKEVPQVTTTKAGRCLVKRAAWWAACGAC